MSAFLEFAGYITWRDWHSIERSKEARRFMVTHEIAAAKRGSGHRTQQRGEGLCLQSLRDLHRRGRTTEDVLAEIEGIDHATLANLDSSSEGSVDQWKPVTEKNPEGLAFVVDPLERIVAYWQFVALNEEMFVRTTRGEVEDGEITAGQVCEQRTPGVYDIYIVMVGVLRQYRSQYVAWMLMHAFFHRLEELAERDIYVRNVCANTRTREGAGICRLIKMQYIGPHQRHGEIYLLNLPRAARVLSRYPELEQRYRRAIPLINTV
jgi:ribosomal protein S18 acetylase RimI-like enzyme